MHRVLIPTEGHEPESWEIALEYALAIAKKNGVAPRVTLLIHTKRQIDHTSLSGHIGKQQSKALSSNKSLRLKDGTLSLQTLKTRSGRQPNGIVIAYYADDELLEAADDIQGLLGVIAVPDFRGECDSWVKRWGGIVHGEGQQSATQLIADPVVEKALTQLLSMVNPSTGIGHPRDKTHANEVLRILRAKGHALDVDAVRSWVIQQGWKSRQADDFAKLAEKVMALKSRPRISGFHDPEGRYARWQ